jgi:hypothetical protein
MSVMRQAELLEDQPHFGLHKGERGLVLDEVTNERGERGYMILCRGEIAVVPASEVSVEEVKAPWEE